MKKFNILKVIVILVAILCRLNVSGQGAINVDFQDSGVTPTQICFDVYLSTGTGYNPAQTGGEWTGMTLSFDLDFIIASGNPVLSTGGLVITNKNTNIVDNTLGSVTASNNFIGNSPAGYEREYRFNLQNLSQATLPATPTRAFTACIPIIGGTIAVDGDSDIRVRTSGGGFAIWSNGVLVSQPVSPFEAMDPLPIELITFESRSSKCDSYLYWETATERNLGYFQIEASKDGQEFKALAQQKPQSPNSLEQRTYKYSVPKNYQGFYFRLKAVDLDGVFNYSPVVATEVLCDKQYGMQLYPNPNYVEKLTVEIQSAEAQEQVQLVVLDALGKAVQLQKVDLLAGTNKVPIDTENLPSGTYYVRLLGVPQLSEPLKFIRSNF